MSTNLPLAESRSERTACLRCGKILERRRLPVSSRELLLLSSVFAIAAAATLGMDQIADFTSPIPKAALASATLLPLLVLGMFWLLAHLSRSTPRCYACAVTWRLNSVFSPNPVHPLLVVLVMLIFALQYYVIPQLVTESAHWVHLGLLEAACAALVLLCWRNSLNPTSEEHGSSQPDSQEESPTGSGVQQGTGA